MTLDINGGLKNTDISSNKYVVIDELLSNAIDSYLIRRESEQFDDALTVEIKIDFEKHQLFEEFGEKNITISCTDNGAGFGPQQLKAFVTRDSTFKDHLKISGLGKCKGTGRIQFFHFFTKLTISSVVSEADQLSLVELNVNENTREIQLSDFKHSAIGDVEKKTTLELSWLKEDAARKHFDSNGVKSDLAAETIKQHLFMTFLNRLIFLKGVIGDFDIKISDNLAGHSNSVHIRSAELPSPTETSVLPLTCIHGNSKDQKAVIKISRYSLQASKFKDSKHEVALCANSSVVLSLSKHYFRNQRDREKPINEMFELIFVESEILENTVNDQRDNFNLKKDCVGSDLLSGFSLQDIIDSIEDYVYQILTPQEFDRENLVKLTNERFGITQSMISEANIKIRYSDDEESIAKRVLRKYQEDIVKDTSEIFDLKKELVQLDPRSENFREKIGELSWKYTSTIKKVDMANLSQLVVRRSSILDVLKMSIDSMLACQQDEFARQQNEKIIHNIFFPTGKDSTDNVDHDIWLLNEEHHYFDHIASDKPLASFPWDDTTKVFESDVDERLEALFKENNEKHRLKRPDIAIFNEEGAAVIVEFKAPGVGLQDHISDLIQYARLLAAKSNGRIRKIYGYLIGDTIDDSRMPGSYTQFPSGMGYFSSEAIIDHKTRIPYGELYSEVLQYSQFVDRATKRLAKYREKLNLK